MRGCVPLCLIAAVGQALADCGPAPVVVPITDVKLSNGHSRRGIQVAVGTPPRNVSFAGNSFLNDTWIYNSTASLCSNSTEERCFTLRGGLYDPENSTSSAAFGPDVEAAGGNPSDIKREVGRHLWLGSSWAQDNLTIGDATIKNYTIGMPGLEFGGAGNTPANLGLGQDSVLLQRLKDEGRIASRSWSFWWGVSNSESRSAMDGQIVLGGYDAAKVTGTPFTQPLREPTPNCYSGMMLSVNSLVLNFPNGTTQDLNSFTTFTSCIQMEGYGVMAVRADPYFWRFQEATQTQFIGKSTGTYWWNPLYSPEDVYAGDLAIQIAGGPSITIPNDVLIVPDQYIDDSGVLRTNDSAAALLIDALDGVNANDRSTISVDFFSGAYLTVNLDNSTWSIWTANATTNTNIVTIGDDHCEQTADPVAPVADSESVPPPAEETTGLESGAIAGIAVGGACAVLLIVGALVLIVLKRRKSRQVAELTKTANQHPSPSDEKQPPYYVYPEDPQHMRAEVEGTYRHPAELYSQRDPAELEQYHLRPWKAAQSRGHAVELPSS